MICCCVEIELLFIKYPATTDEGIAYIFNVEQWNNINFIYGDVNLN